MNVFETTALRLFPTFDISKPKKLWSSSAHKWKAFIDALVLETEDDLQKQPSSLQLINVKDIITKQFDQESKKQLLHSWFVKLNVHALYFTALQELSLSHKMHYLYLQFKQHTTSFPKLHHFLNHIQQLQQYNQQELGNISEWDALYYCTEHLKLKNLRFELLLFLNRYQYDTTKLKQMIFQRQENLTKSYHIHVSTKQFLAKHVTYGHYVSLCHCLNQIDMENIQNVPKDFIVQQLVNTSFTNASSIYKLLKCDLERKGNQETLLYIKQHLPHKFTSLSKLNRLRLLSSWHDHLISEIIVNLTEASRTSFPKNYQEMMESQIATMLSFITEYTMTHFEKEDPLKYFLDHYHEMNIAHITSAFVTSRKIQNDKVKSSLHLHSASNPVAELQHFLKIGLQHRISYHSNDLNQANFVKTLENKRVAADINERRSFTDDEIERMLVVAANKQDYLLILTLLREVGLRISAIVHLKIHMVIDTTTKLPRDLCSVPEKALTFRQFVTSSVLKTRIANYVQSLEYKNMDDYLFYPNRLVSTSTVSSHLKKIAKEAKVSINMHAHAFRHTIVGKLIECGNTMETVSRFMGHHSCKTTERHYFISTISQLHESMNNPFTNTFNHNKRLHSDASSHELKIEKAKRQKLSDLICCYHNIIADNCKAQRSANDIRKDIFIQFPNLQQMLQELE